MADAPEEVIPEDEEEVAEVPEESSIIPDDLSQLDEHRPNLGSQSGMAQTLWEEAAVLGTLRDGLQAAKFDADETWQLVLTFAQIRWNSRFMDWDDEEDDE